MARTVDPIRAIKVTKPKVKPKAVPSIFTLCVELAESVPTIWRQIDIGSRATL